MKSAEYEEILASLQEIVRQAYALGRSEALKQVVEVLKTDEVPPKPLALMAPVEAPPSMPPQQQEAERVEATPALAAEEAVHDRPSAAAPGNAPVNGPDAGPDSGHGADQPNPEPVALPWWSRPARAL